MKGILRSVGERAINRVTDVALVQAMLLRTSRPSGGTYLSSYNGRFDPATLQAIHDFQRDKFFNGKQSSFSAHATAGVINPNDDTWRTLARSTMPGFRDLRVLDGGKTVYIQATTVEVQRNVVAAQSSGLVPSFKSKIIDLIQRMFDVYGIAVSICADGEKRSFQKQYDQKFKHPRTTGAGPGESNHNFGMAADVGFKGLQWLKPNGTVVQESAWWLKQLDPHETSPESRRFWDALHTVGEKDIGLFPTTKPGDRPHFQAWDDSNVHMGPRLAVHLTRSGTMNWDIKRGRPNIYLCDLGLGGSLYPVGSAMEIWIKNAPITLHMLTQARGGTPATSSDLNTMKEKLRHDFDLAEQNAQNWTPY